ncbi:MAG: hypothetical protein AB7G28_11060 [Pirellulales bacterium]
MAQRILQLGLTAISTLGAWSSACAQFPVAMPAGQEFAAIEAKYSEAADASKTQGVVHQVAYAETSAPLPAPTPAFEGPRVVSPTSGTATFVSPYPAPQSAGEVIIPPSTDAWCVPPQPPGRTSSWTAAIELIPSFAHVTDGQFGRWDDDGTLALRLLLGYEDPEGIGIRARFWALSQASETQLDDVELNMGKFDLDLYKRFFLERGEIALGAGPSSGGLEFKLDGDGHSRFEGAGGTVFLDGYYGLIYFDHSELGAVGRARYSMLIGDWRDTTGFLIPPTDNDTMGVTEIAWGLEYRSRFGPCEDHSWFVGVLAEYQRWQSDWMSNLAGTSVGVSGVNVYTGLNW